MAALIFLLSIMVQKNGNQLRSWLEISPKVNCDKLVYLLLENILFLAKRVYVICSICYINKCKLNHLLSKFKSFILFCSFSLSFYRRVNQKMELDNRLIRIREKVQRFLTSPSRCLTRQSLESCLANSKLKWCSVRFEFNDILASIKGTLYYKCSFLQSFFLSLV